MAQRIGIRLELLRLGFAVSVCPGMMIGASLFVKVCGVG
jgi:hypothetical protein